jgi:hypothetical protein
MICETDIETAYQYNITIIKFRVSSKIKLSSDLTILQLTQMLENLGCYYTSVLIF